VDGEALAAEALVEAEAVLERLDTAVRCPVFEDHGGGKGRCLRYETRPTLCRLFGFAGVADKYGLVRLAVCRVQKERGLAVEETVRPPAFAEFGRRLAALAPEYGTELMPIREALRVALEKVLLLERLAGPTASR
jgi:Fe-S-cluster containining protein